MNKERLLQGKRGRGFSLIEVLVAIVVLAIGVLGVAALQSKSMSQGQGSLQATQAIALAYDYADRIRANPCGAYLGNYEIVRTSPPTTAPSKLCNSSSNNCTGSELGQYDRYDWYTNQVLKKLPRGSAVQVQCADTAASASNKCTTSHVTICGQIPNPAQPITITIWWIEKGMNNDQAVTSGTYGCGSTNSSTSSTDLPCVTLSVQP